MRPILKGLLLKPTLNLLTWILRRNGNSIIIGGPLGWSWEATLDATHHGSLAGPANAHRHSDLANIGADDHHARLHPTEHQDGGVQEINIGGLSGEPADVVPKSLFDAQTILIAVTDNNPVALAVAASRIVGRKSTGNIVALTGAELMAILSGQAGAAFSMNSQRMTTLGTPTSAGDALRKGTRVTVAELPALTDEKIWKGTGGDPEEIDVPAGGLLFTELEGDEDKYVTTTGTWEDWNLSSIVPAGAKVIEVFVMNGSSSNYRVGVRKNGSALNRFLAANTDPTKNYFEPEQLVTVLSEVDANRVLEIYATGTAIRFAIKGYWS